MKIHKRCAVDRYIHDIWKWENGRVPEKMNKYVYLLHCTIKNEYITSKNIFLPSFRQVDGCRKSSDKSVRKSRVNGHCMSDYLKGEEQTLVIVSVNNVV